jgi:hypothetical protein
MACVGILSAHDRISEADRIVTSLEELTLADLESILHQKTTVSGLDS